MILCDLPYGTTACKWDSCIPLAPLWAEYLRVTKENAAIVLMGSQPFTSALIMSNPKLFRYEWIWVKNYSGGFILAKKQPMKYHENVLVFSRSQPTYNPIFEEYAESTKQRFAKSGKESSQKMVAAGYKNEVQGIKRVEGEIMLSRGAYPKSVQKIQSPPVHHGLRLHPTQKPVELMEYFIRTYTNKGETVLDNCMGSGTTGVACVNLKRNFIGIEKDQKYFDIAKARIKAV